MKIKKRLLPSVLASLLTVSLTVPSYAASVSASDLNSLRTLSAAVQTRDTNSAPTQTELSEETIRLAQSLVTRFIDYNKDYYREHADIDRDFIFYNCSSYLSANGDVAEQIRGQLENEGLSNQQAEKEKRALEDYLTAGAEGFRRSGSAFDPVYAILSNPAAYAERLTGTERPEDIFRIYHELTGKLTTMDLILSKAGDRYVLTDRVLSGIAASSYGYAGSSDDGEETAAYIPINQDARTDLKGYRLYRNVSAPGVHSISCSTASGGTLQGYFYSDTYRSIQKSAGSQQKYTVVVYLCGTNLEDNKEGGASEDIVNMLKAQYDISSANVLILAGGTKDWDSETMVNDGNNDINCCLYYLDPSAMSDKVRNKLAAGTAEKNDVITSDTLKLLANFNDVSMGDAELLLGALDTAYDLFPAENYWLSLWNHGGGSADGICTPDVKEGETAEGLTLAKIESALAGSEICQKGNGFSIISMDACLMGGIETAWNLSPYAQYFIGSEEMTYGMVPYDQYFAYFKEGPGLPSASEIAVNASKAYMETHQRDHITTSTNTCFDLSKLKSSVDALNTLGTAMTALFRSEETRDNAYRAMRDAAALSIYFGGDTRHSIDDYADLGYFMNKLSAALQAEMDKLPEGENKEAYGQALQAISGINASDFAAFEEHSFLQSDEAFKEFHGDELCGATVFLPFHEIGYLNYDSKQKAQFENKGLVQYLRESILSDYAAFLDEYVQIANSETEISRLQGLNNMLNYQYVNLFSSGEVLAYTYEHKGTDGTVTPYKDYVLRLNFAKDEGKYSDSPVTAFMETVSNVAVQIMRQDNVKVKTDAGTKVQPVDLIICTSPDVCPSMYISSNAAVGNADQNSSGDALIIDTSLVDAIAYYLTGTTVSVGGNEMKISTFDWGTPVTIFDDYWNQEHTASLQALNLSSDNTVGLSAQVDIDLTEKTDNKTGTMLFKKDDADENYVYAGFIYKDDTEAKTFLELTAAQTSDATLFHYYLPENGGVTLVEQNGTTLENQPVFDTKEKITVTKTDVSASMTKKSDETFYQGNGSEHNKYAVKVTAADGTESEIIIGNTDAPEGKTAKDSFYNTNDHVGTEQSKTDGTDKGQTDQDEDETVKSGDETGAAESNGTEEIPEGTDSSLTEEIPKETDESLTEEAPEEINSDPAEDDPKAEEAETEAPESEAEEEDADAVPEESGAQEADPDPEAAAPEAENAPAEDPAA